MQRRLLPFFACSALTACSAGSANVEPTSTPQATSQSSAPRAAPTQADPEGPAAGGPEERLTQGPEDELFPVVDGSGALLLYQAESYTGTGEDRKLATQWVLADTLPPSKATLHTHKERASSQPSFVPKAGYVYLTNALGPLAIVKAETSALGAPLAVVIASDKAPSLAEPAVSPDGTRVAFSMAKDKGGRSVAVVGIDGSKLSVVGEGRSPAWSPTQNRLAFIRTAGGYNHIFTVDATTLSNPTPITKGDFDCDRPSYSPDGSQLVFASNRANGSAGTDRSASLHLFVATASGDKIEQLTRGSGREATPYWAADGWIYFSSNRSGNYDIYRVKPR